jgi:predicted nuclease with TOPRIM domain
MNADLELAKDLRKRLDEKIAAYDALKERCAEIADERAFLSEEEARHSGDPKGFRAVRAEEARGIALKIRALA